MYKGLGLSAIGVGGNYQETPQQRKYRDLYGDSAAAQAREQVLREGTKRGRGREKKNIKVAKIALIANDIDWKDTKQHFSNTRTPKASYIRKFQEM